MAAPMWAEFQLFSWGANSYGQLAQNHKEDIMSPTCIKELDICPHKISGGGGHTMFLDQGNRVWSCGWNTKGQLGLDINHSDVPRPLHVKVLDTHNVVKIATGWDFSVALTKDGSVYSWGSNVFGQMGVPSVSKCSNKPMKIDFPQDDKIVDISAGLRHAGAVCENGRVYMWGSGKKGQLGVIQSGKHVRQLSPIQVALPKGHVEEKACHIVTGTYHTAVLSESGLIFAWGENKHGVITIPPTITRLQIIPHVVARDNFDTKVCKLYSGWTHMLAKTESGNIYTWGRNDYGQLGRDKDMPFDAMPQSLSGIKDPVDITCGSEHTLLLTKDNELLSWGWNEHGICGTGDELDVNTPTKISSFNNIKVTAIGCGMGHSFALVFPNSTPKILYGDQ